MSISLTEKDKETLLKYVEVNPEHFSGYHPLAANYAQIPMEVVHDPKLGPNDHHTLLVLTALIAFQQFRLGAGRHAPVPIPWRVIAQRLHLSEDAAKARVSALEALARIRILEGPCQLVEGRCMDGPNLFALRWQDEAPSPSRPWRTSPSS